MHASLVAIKAWEGRQNSVFVAFFHAKTWRTEDAEAASKPAGRAIKQADDFVGVCIRLSENC